MEADSLDPRNMVYKSNIGAVFFEKGEYDRAIESCLKALEVGNENHADYKLKARALQRIGNCYSKLGDYENAIEYFRKSMVEENNRTTHDLLKKAESEYEEKKRSDYIDPELSNQARLEGNEFFKQHKFPEAVKSYSEAIKRNPTDKVPYTNRATAYVKLGAIPDALKDCEKAIELDPTYVKAYLKKANCHSISKDFVQALETYERALKIEPENQEVINGFQQTRNKIENETIDEETVKRNIQNNPDLMHILQDPNMQKVFQDIQSNNREAILAHLSNPDIATKLEKLRTAGFIR